MRYLLKKAKEFLLPKPVGPKWFEVNKGSRYLVFVGISGMNQTMANDLVKRMWKDHGIMVTVVRTRGPAPTIYELDV